MFCGPLSFDEQSIKVTIRHLEQYRHEPACSFNRIVSAEHVDKTAT